MKKQTYIWLLMVFLVSTFVVASQVMVLKFHYIGGEVTLVDQVVKKGFSPDYKLFGDEAYTLVTADDDGVLLSSLQFDVPLILYADVTTPDGMSGGMVERDDFDFALVVPYTADVASVEIISPEGKTLLEEAVVVAEDSMFTSVWFWVVVLIILIVLFMIWFRRKG
jgi:hypothetical protein